MTTFNRLAIADVIEIVPAKFGDDRGFFSETWKASDFAGQGLALDFVQDNHSFSAPVGTVRGLHYQTAPFAQDKLIRVIRGAIFDVAVDCRTGSPSYGTWAGIELSAARWNQLLVPIGFAHGFMTTAPDTEVIYKVTAAWSRAHEVAIAWNDPELGIEWPEVGEATLSDKDRAAPAFRTVAPAFEYRPR